jgi:Ax21 family sulfation-dependent quorum factor
MKRTLLALALIATPFAAVNASELSYNYVEAGYTRITGAGTKIDGWGTKGSVALGTNFHLFGGYSNYDVRGLSSDLDSWNLGVGYNHSLNRSADLIARVGYERNEIASIKDDVWFTEVGVRGAMSPNFEGYVLAGYERSDNFDNEFYGRVGAQYKFNQTWGINADVKFVDGDTQYLIGPRLSF